MMQLACQAPAELHHSFTTAGRQFRMLLPAIPSRPQVPEGPLLRRLLRLLQPGGRPEGVRLIMAGEWAPAELAAAATVIKVMLGADDCCNSGLLCAVRGRRAAGT